MNRHLLKLHHNTKTKTDNIIKMEFEVKSDVEEVEWAVGEG